MNLNSWHLLKHSAISSNWLATTSNHSLAWSLGVFGYLCAGASIGFTQTADLSNEANSAISESESLQQATSRSEEEFQRIAIPFLEQYCLDCHGPYDPAAKLDTSVFENGVSVANQWSSWKAMLSRIHEGEMPPLDYDPKPTEEERAELEGWTERFRLLEAKKHAGDPGPANTRRLNNAEFNYSIRDLIGVDIRPAESFPVDPANEAGFDNSAESLTISPALVNKYLDAARFVSEHMLLTTDGIQFAPHPIVSDTDRDKYGVQKIVDFYLDKPTDLSRYLHAAWKVERRLADNPPADHRGDSARAEQELETIAAVADELSVSPRYLRTVWEFLTQKDWRWGPGRSLQSAWRDLPRSNKSEEDVIASCEKLSKQIASDREKLRPRVPNLNGPMGVGSQPVILWKNRRIASLRQVCAPEFTDPSSESSKLSESEKNEISHRGAEAQSEVTMDYEAFCRTFPDAFYIKERGRTYLSEDESAKEAGGRLLSAGFHSMMGFFRDDQPLYDLILSADEQSELDQLWRELRFSSDVPLRQYAGFLWYERAESSYINDRIFDFIRAEDKSATTDAMIERFASVYMEKVSGASPSEELVHAVERFFQDVRTDVDAHHRMLEDAKPRHLSALLSLAGRAYRKPLSKDDESAILSFYEESLKLPSADHRTAMEDTLVSILLSPKFLYRWDLQNPVAGIDREVQHDVAETQSEGDIYNIRHESTSLSDVELASRLSFFLWSSGPDDVLLDAAREGTLTEQPVRVAQMRRMLADEKSSGMLLEFMGNWLDFRRFDQHNAVDRDVFPQFDDELRASMAQEPIELLKHLVQTDGKITDLINADYVIVNDKLAHFYGAPGAAAISSGDWVKIEKSGEFQRGGLLPMGLFLTQNSPGLRTSPVKRGYWVVRKLLGEKIPPPPPDVPELPSSEAHMGELTLRETLAIHREHASCAACHNRFDAAGLLLEGFDPIGRPRQVDLGGREVSTDAVLPDGSEAVGLAGLNAYINEKRLDDFRRNFCESLVAFALNRSLIIPDDLLVENMMESLRANGDTISAAFECLLNSPQFLNKRVVQVPQSASLSPTKE